MSVSVMGCASVASRMAVGGSMKPTTRRVAATSAITLIESCRLFWLAPSVAIEDQSPCRTCIARSTITTP